MNIPTHWMTLLAASAYASIIVLVFTFFTVRILSTRTRNRKKLEALFQVTFFTMIGKRVYTEIDPFIGTEREEVERHLIQMGFKKDEACSTNLLPSIPFWKDVKNERVFAIIQLSKPVGHLKFRLR